MEARNAFWKPGRRGKLTGTLVASAALALSAVPTDSQATPLTVPKPETQPITTPQPVQPTGNTTQPMTGSSLPSGGSVPTPSAAVTRAPDPGPQPALPPLSLQAEQGMITGNCSDACMREWSNFEKHFVEAKEWELRYAEFVGADSRTIQTLTRALEVARAESASFQKLWASQGAGAGQNTREQQGFAKEAKAHDAAEYAEEHDDDYVQATDEYFDEHNDELLSVPVAGTILQELLKPVFEAFKAAPKTTAEATPVGHSMPESPNGEPLAAVSIRTLLGPDDTNSSKF